MVSITLHFVRMVVAKVVAKVAEFQDVTVTDVIDVSQAEVIGDFGGVGSYANPAIDRTVPLQTGTDPAATVAFGGPEQMAVDTTVEDPSGTVDPDQDLTVFAEPIPDGGGELQFVFRWASEQADPGSNVDVRLTVSKLI